VIVFRVIYTSCSVSRLFQERTPISQAPRIWFSPFLLLFALDCLWLSLSLNHLLPQSQLKSLSTGSGYFFNASLETSEKQVSLRVISGQRLCFQDPFMFPNMNSKVCYLELSRSWWGMSECVYLRRWGWLKRGDEPMV